MLASENRIGLTSKDFVLLGSALMLWLVCLSALATDLDTVVLSGQKDIFYAIALSALFLSSIYFALKFRLKTVLRAMSCAKLVIFYCLSILVSQIIISLVLARAPLSSLLMATGYVLSILCGFFVIALSMKKKFLRDNLFFALVFLGVSSTIIAILSSLFGIGTFFGLKLENTEFMSSIGIYSTQAMFRQRTAYGTQVFLGIIGSLYFLGKKRSGIFPFLSIVFCGFGVFLSWGRGVWLATCLSLITWVWVGKGTRWKVLITAVVVFSGIGIFFLVTTSPFWASLAIVKRGLSGRGILWPIAIEMIRSSPLFGRGMGQVPEVKYEFVSRQVGEKLTSSGFHNFFLDTAASSGLPTAIIFTLIIFSCFHHLLRSNMDIALKRVLSAGILGMLTIAFFTTYNIGGLRAPSFALTVFLGMSSVLPAFSYKLSNKNR